MSGLSEDAAAPLHGRAREAHAAEGDGDRSAPERPSILSRLASAPDIAKIALSAITFIAAVMFLSLVVIEWRTVRTVVEPLQVPQELADKGITPEVMSSMLLDRIAATGAFDRFRGRPAAIAAGWGTTEVKIPLLDVSVGSLAGLAKTLLGPEDLRVAGEVVAMAGEPATYMLQLRLKDPVRGWIPLPPSGPSAEIATLFDQPVQNLLLQTDPLSVATYAYVTRVEGYRNRPAVDPDGSKLCNLHERGLIIDAIAACINRCTTRDRALAYLLWGDLLRKASELRGGDGLLLNDALDKYAASVDTAATTAVAYTHWADTLFDLNRPAEGRAMYATAVGKFTDEQLASYDWAERLTMPFRRGLDARTGDSRQDLETAVTSYAASAALDPKNDWTLTRWGEAQLFLDRPQDAASTFRRAILLNGGNAAAHRGLCETLQRQGDQGGAALMCSRAGVLDGVLGKAGMPPVTAQTPCARSLATEASTIVGR